MYITVNEFLAGAFDNYYDLKIYDFSICEDVYDSKKDKEEKLDAFLEYEVVSWQVEMSAIILNIDTE